MAVTKLLITSRRPFAQEQTFGHVGPYEQLDGTVSFAVDPNHSANQLITDLKLAPRDVSGRVHFWADWRLLRPVEPQRGNHRLLFDILNRGRGPGLRNLNSAQDVAPTEPLDPGNGFLMRQGYTVAWCGWQHDVPDAPGLMRLHAPEAVTPEGPISGKIMVTFQPIAPASVQFLADRIPLLHQSSMCFPVLKEPAADGVPGLLKEPAAARLFDLSMSYATLCHA